MPDTREKYCVKCGAETLESCPNCLQPLRGDYYVPGVLSVSSHFEMPYFCYSCGNAYPWTIEYMKAVDDLVQFENNLTDEEREIIAKDFNELIRDSPRTQVAAQRTKSLMAKASEETKSGFRDITVDIISETAKKILFPE